MMFIIIMFIILVPQQLVQDVVHVDAVVPDRSGRVQGTYTILYYTMLYYAVYSII